MPQSSHRRKGKTRPRKPVQSRFNPAQTTALSGRLFKLLQLFVGLNVYTGKKYCYPSQWWLLKMMKRRWSVSICRRTLYTYIKALEAKGLLVKVKRQRKKSAGLGLVMDTNLYIITKRGYGTLRGYARMLTGKPRFKSWGKKKTDQPAAQPDPQARAASMAGNLFASIPPVPIE